MLFYACRGVLGYFRAVLGYFRFAKPYFAVAVLGYFRFAKLYFAGVLGCRGALGGSAARSCVLLSASLAGAGVLPPHDVGRGPRLHRRRGARAE